MKIYIGDGSQVPTKWKCETCKDKEWMPSGALKVHLAISHSMLVEDLFLMTRTMVVHAPSKSGHKTQWRLTGNGISLAQLEEVNYAFENGLPQKPKRPRSPKQLANDELLLELASIEAGHQVATITGPEASRHSRSLHDIRLSTPALTKLELRRRANNYHSHFGGCPITSSALSKWWTKCDRPDPKSKFRSPTGTAEAMDRNIERVVGA